MLYSILMTKFIFLVMCQATVAERPYEVEIQAFEPIIFKKAIFDPQTLRVNRKGRNVYAITGNFSLLMNLGDDSTMAYEIMKKSEISKNYMVLVKGGGNICTFTSTNTNFYPRFRTFTNFPDPNVCPFPKGNYAIKDYTLDESILPLTLSFYVK